MYNTIQAMREMSVLSLLFSHAEMKMKRSNKIEKNKNSSIRAFIV